MTNSKERVKSNGRNYRKKENQTHFIDIDLGLRTSLHENTIPISGQSLALLPAHNTLIIKVTFVAHKDQWHLLRVLHTKNLLVEISQVVECRLRGDGIAKDKALTILHVEITHCGELFLEYEIHKT